MEYNCDINKLTTGKTYRVITEFVDYDRIIHKIGEEWVFDSTTFLPYHSGLSVFVIENGKNVCYRFQEVPEEQQDLLNTFMDYVELVEI